MALQDLDHARWFRPEKAGTLPWRDVVHAHRLMNRLGATRDGAGASRRPVPPSRRLPRAHMGRPTFLILIAGWLAAVAAVLALVLVFRAFA